MSSETFIIFVSIIIIFFVLFSVMVRDNMVEKRFKKQQKKAKLLRAEAELLRAEAECRRKELAKARAVYSKKTLNDRGSDVYERRWVDDWWREQP